MEREELEQGQVEFIQEILRPAVEEVKALSESAGLNNKRKPELYLNSKEKNENSDGNSKKLCSERERKRLALNYHKENTLLREKELLPKELPFGNIIGGRSLSNIGYLDPKTGVFSYFYNFPTEIGPQAQKASSPALYRQMIKDTIFESHIRIDLVDKLIEKFKCIHPNFNYKESTEDEDSLVAKNIKDIKDKVDKLNEKFEEKEMKATLVALKTDNDIDENKKSLLIDKIEQAMRFYNRGQISHIITRTIDVIVGGLNKMKYVTFPKEGSVENENAGKEIDAITGLKSLEIRNPRDCKLDKVSEKIEYLFWYPHVPELIGSEEWEEKKKKYKKGTVPRNNDPEILYEVVARHIVLVFNSFKNFGRFNEKHKKTIIRGFLTRVVEKQGWKNAGITIEDLWQNVNRFAEFDFGQNKFLMRKEVLQSSVFPSLNEPVSANVNSADDSNSDDKNFFLPSSVDCFSPVIKQREPKNLSHVSPRTFTFCHSFRHPTEIGPQAEHVSAVTGYRQMVNNIFIGKPFEKGFVDKLIEKFNSIYPVFGSQNPSVLEHLDCMVKNLNETNKFFKEEEIEAVSGVLSRANGIDENLKDKLEKAMEFSNRGQIVDIFSKVIDLIMASLSTMKYVTFPKEGGVENVNTGRERAAKDYLNFLSFGDSKDYNLYEISEKIEHLFWYPRIPGDKLLNVRSEEWIKIEKAGKYTKGTKPRDNNPDILYFVLARHIVLMFNSFEGLERLSSEDKQKVVNGFLSKIIEKQGWSKEPNISLESIKNGIAKYATLDYAKSEFIMTSDGRDIEKVNLVKPDPVCRQLFSEKEK